MHDRIDEQVFLSIREETLAEADEEIARRLGIEPPKREKP